MDKIVKLAMVCLRELAISQRAVSVQTRLRSQLKWNKTYQELLRPNRKTGKPESAHQILDNILEIHSILSPATQLPSSIEQLRKVVAKSFPPPPPPPREKAQPTIHLAFRKNSEK